VIGVYIQCVHFESTLNSSIVSFTCVHIEGRSKEVYEGIKKITGKQASRVRVVEDKIRRGYFLLIRMKSGADGLNPSNTSSSSTILSIP